MSVGRVCDAGNIVVFGKNGGFMQHEIAAREQSIPSEGWSCVIPVGFRSAWARWCLDMHFEAKDESGETSTRCSRKVVQVTHKCKSLQRNHKGELSILSRV